MMLCLLALLAAPAIAAARDGRVIALTSNDLPPFQQALTGFVRQLAEQRGNLTVDQYRVDTDPERAQQMLKGVQADDIVLALGTPAAQLVGRNMPTAVVAVCMVLTTEGLPATLAGNAVSLEFNSELQMDWLHRILPTAQRVGVLFQPASNAKRVEQAAAAARRIGAQLIATPVESPAELPDALDRLMRDIDVLWVIPDPVVVSPQTIKALLLAGFRAKVPVIGLSEAWVKAGALYALEWDYEETGRQCGLKAMRGSGKAVSRTVHMALNLRTARTMRLPLGEGVIGSARRTYE